MKKIVANYWAPVWPNVSAYASRVELVDSAAELVAEDDERLAAVAMDASRQMSLAHAWHSSDLWGWRGLPVRRCVK